MNKNIRSLCVVLFLCVVIAALFYKCKPATVNEPAPVTGISTNGVISDK